MRRAVVDNPKDTACLIVRGPGHDLLDEAIERSDAAFAFRSAEDAGVMHIECGHVGLSALTSMGPRFLRSIPP